jgi:hypothetical protein
MVTNLKECAMTFNHNATANVHGAEVNISEEYHRARKLMGFKTTNHEALLRAAITVYLNIPKEYNEWVEVYASLIDEMKQRIELIARLEVDC